MKRIAFCFLLIMSDAVMAHPGSHLDGTHTDTLALVLMMVAVLLATIASKLIVEGYLEQASKFLEEKASVTSAAKNGQPLQND